METQTAGPASNLEIDPADRENRERSPPNTSLQLTSENVGADTQRSSHPQGREVHGAETSLEAGGAGQVDVFLPGEPANKVLNTGRHH